MDQMARIHTFHAGIPGSSPSPTIYLLKGRIIENSKRNKEIIETGQHSRC